jgi:hypothetical protein
MLAVKCDHTCYCFRTQLLNPVVADIAAGERYTQMSAIKPTGFKANLQPTAILIAYSLISSMASPDISIILSMK